jgi:hypothetical protein
MRGSIEFTYPTPSAKLDQKLLLPSSIGFRKSTILNGLVVSRKSAINFDDLNLTARVGVGILTGIIAGAILAVLFGDNVLVSDDLSPLLFSREFLSIIGFTPSAAVTVAGSITGLMLGGLIGALSSFEALE